MFFLPRVFFRTSCLAGSSSWRLKNIHSGHITSLAWWDGERGEQIDLFMTGGQVRGRGQCCVAFHGCSACLMVLDPSSKDGCLRVWDRRARKCLHNLELHVNDRGVGALSDIIPPMAATGQKCITAGADGVVSPTVVQPCYLFLGSV